MSYAIASGSPKAVVAAAFGRELVAACQKRRVPLNELERACGVGHTSLDNYRRGLILPKLEVARALATALDWPRLATLIEAARTFTCARAGCGRTFRNDTGAPRRYCSAACQAFAAKLREARRRTSYRVRCPRVRRDRRGGFTVEQVFVDPWTGELLATPVGDDPVKNAYRKGMAIADERARTAEEAIAAMCRSCEPEGVCRTADCPLRPHSPLPLEVHDQRAEPRTVDRIFADAAKKAAPKRRESMRRRWADPAFRARQGRLISAGHVARDPERHEAWLASIRATRKARAEAAA